MTTTELKKLAEAAPPIYPELYGDRYFNDDFSRCDLTKEQDAFLRAAEPDVILKLLAINAELVERLKWIKENPRVHPANLEKIIDAALAKAEGGEL